MFQKYFNKIRTCLCFIGRQLYKQHNYIHKSNIYLKNYKIVSQNIKNGYF